MELKRCAVPKFLLGLLTTCLLSQYPSIALSKTGMSDGTVANSTLRTSTTRPIVSSTIRPVVSSTTRPVVSSTIRPVVSSTTRPVTSTTIASSCPVYSANPGCNPAPNFDDPNQRQAIVTACNQRSGSLREPELTADDKWQNCMVNYSRCSCYDIQGVALYYKTGLCSCLGAVNADYCACYRNCQSAANPGLCTTQTCGPNAATATNKCNSDWHPGISHGSAWAGFWNQTGCATSLAACATLGIK